MSKNVGETKTVILISQVIVVAELVTYRLR